MLYQNERKTFLIEEISISKENDKKELNSQKVLKLYLIGRLTVEEHKEGFRNLF